MTATQANTSSSNTLVASSSLSDVATRRRQTSFKICHVDIEIEAAEAYLAQLRKQRVRLIEMLAYDDDDF